MDGTRDGISDPVGGQGPFQQRISEADCAVPASSNTTRVAADLDLILPAMRVKIKSWTGVAQWKWIANDDNCGICRNAFDGCCTDCKMPGDDCPLVWGQCSHCFHIHCIMKWLNSQHVHQLCPMCRQEWKFRNE